MVHACEVDASTLVSSLLSKRVDPNRARITDGITPIIACAVHGSLGAVGVLLEHAELVIDQAENKGKRTALHLACQSGRTGVTETLLSHGAHATAEATGGRTPLYIAAENGSLGSVMALLRSGALRAHDVSHETAKCVSPLAVAQRRGHSAVAGALNAFTEGEAAASGTAAGRPSARAKSCFTPRCLTTRGPSRSSASPRPVRRPVSAESKERCASERERDPEVGANSGANTPRLPHVQPSPLCSAPSVRPAPPTPRVSAPMSARLTHACKSALPNSQRMPRRTPRRNATPASRRLPVVVGAFGGA